MRRARSRPVAVGLTVTGSSPGRTARRDAARRRSSWHRAQHQRPHGRDGRAGPSATASRTPAPAGVSRTRRPVAPVACSAHARPGERQAPAGVVAAGASGPSGVQAGVQQRRVQAEAARRPSSSGSVDLGEDSSPRSPGRAQALERRAVVEAAARPARRRGRPGRSGSAPAAARRSRATAGGVGRRRRATPVACRGPRRPSSRSPGVHRARRVGRPSSGAPTATWTSTLPRSGSTSGASGSARRQAAADLVAGVQGQLDEGRAGDRRAAGRRGRRATGGCARDSRPVNTTPSLSASGTRRRAAGGWPASPAGADAGAGSSQPVALALEGVGGQVDLPGGGRRTGRPSPRRRRGRAPGQPRCSVRRRLVPVARAGTGDRVTAVASTQSADHRGQHRVRARAPRTR